MCVSLFEETNQVPGQNDKKDLLVTTRIKFLSPFSTDLSGYLHQNWKFYPEPMKKRNKGKTHKEIDVHLKNVKKSVENEKKNIILIAFGFERVRVKLNCRKVIQFFL